MPIKKTYTKERPSILDESFSVQKLMKGSESYKSLIYGIVTVIVLFVVLALGIRSLSQNKAQIDNEAVSTQSTVTTPEDSRYTVKDGETLWSISEAKYHDGFSWHVIANANNISDPYSLSTGTKLLIPKIIAVPTEKPQQKMVTNQNDKITSSTYTVIHGDNLWNIAIRAYGDGYRWPEIAKSNNLSNPGLIFSGNVLKLPRP